MDTKMNESDTDNIILNVLDDMRAFTRKLQESREKRIWRNVSVPCTLLDAVKRLTKFDLDNIRKELDLKNLSSLKKDEMAEALADQMPGKFREVLLQLDKGRYGLLKTIVERGGVINGSMRIDRAESLMRYGLAFPGIYRGERVIFMPQELVDAFIQMDGTELENIVTRNTEWILLTQGMLYYYGVMGAFAAWKKVQQYTKQEIDLREYWQVMAIAADTYEQLRISKSDFRDDRVFDAKEIIAEQKKMADVDYFPFTKKQLLAAGNPEFADKSPAMNDFIKFLDKHYELDDEEKDEISYQMVYLINSDAKPELMIRYLQTWFEFPSPDFLPPLISAMSTLYNNTRQWRLKGHTPAELSKNENKFLPLLPTDESLSEGFAMEKLVLNTAAAISAVKTGRNDPCPCGSGKKYKKCCGK